MSMIVDCTKALVTLQQGSPGNITAHIMAIAWDLEDIVYSVLYIYNDVDAMLRTHRHLAHNKKLDYTIIYIINININISVYI